MIDLHIHTTASDGDFSSKEIIDKALELGLKAIAITDHDTIDGIQEAIDYAEGKDIEIIPGVEIKCEEKSLNLPEVHILGLFIDSENKKLNNHLELMEKSAINQKQKMVENLNKLGYKINFEEVKKLSNKVIGRLHIAKVLLKDNPDKFSDINDVFRKVLDEDKPGYVARHLPDMKTVIEIIKQANGLVFLAHPGIYGREKSLKLIKLFKEAEGRGLESYYYYKGTMDITDEKQEEMINLYKKIIKDENFLETGGSDFHRESRGPLGSVNVPDSILENLKKER